MKKITLSLITMLLASSFSFSQTYYSQNFNTGGLNSWVTTDLNSDGLQWAVLNASGYNAAFGTGSLVSRSWTNANGAITPNNLITSPLIDLSVVTGYNLKLSYNYLTDTDYFAEHYAIYVTTTNVASAIIATIPVFETTVSTGGYQTKQIDLSNFIGQNVYLSFRHFNCNDQNNLIIDNLELKTVQPNDAQLVSSSLNKYSLLNSSNQLGLTVKNIGGNAISNLTVNWNDGADHISTINTSIASGATATLTHPIPVSYSTVTEKNIAITISQVNGFTDPNTSDNVGSKKINTLGQTSQKYVLFEEGTGTWCGWCPRGAVALNYMSTTYPNEFIGIAIHSGDPMSLPAYDTAANFSGYPSMNVDRELLDESITQSAIQSFFSSRRLDLTPVSLSAEGNITGSNVTINAYATFRTTFANANFRLGVIISEDNVTGTTSDYNQNNVYANNAEGQMGGYESLPSPVPAAQMVYDHVGRALLGGYSGQAGSVPTTITDGQTTNYTFNYTVPATSNVANMHAIIVLIDSDSGAIVNAKSALLTSLTLANNEIKEKSEITMFPNPTSDFFTLSNLESTNYDVTIFDISGKAVQSNGNRTISENGTLTIPVSNLAKGVYMVNIASGKSSLTKQLIVN